MARSLGKSILVMIVALFAVGPVCFAGPEGVGHGGGGDPVAADFAKVAQDAINAMSTLRPVYVVGSHIDESRLQEKFAIASIKSVKGPLVLDGKTVIAINYPDKNEIVIDRSKWPSLGGDDKVQLAIHEFLGLTFPEISDANYQYSRELADRVQALSREIKLFARLTAKRVNDSDENGAVLGETINWVGLETKSAPEGLSGFSIEFARSEGYMTIQLVAPNGAKIWQTKQLIQDTMDFNTTINYLIEINGKHYDQLVLELQEALKRTPQ